MTVATEIWATGLHPYDGKPTVCSHSKEDKDEQRDFFFWYKPEMRGKIASSLKRLGLSHLTEKLLGKAGKHMPVPAVEHQKPAKQYVYRWKKK